MDSFSKIIRGVEFGERDIAEELIAMRRALADKLVFIEQLEKSPNLTEDEEAAAKEYKKKYETAYEALFPLFYNAGDKKTAPACVRPAEAETERFIRSLMTGH